MSLQICDTEFELPETYELLTPLGKGAYGIVWWVSYCVPVTAGEEMVILSEQLCLLQVALRFGCLFPPFHRSTVWYTPQCTCQCQTLLCLCGNSNQRELLVIAKTPTNLCHPMRLAKHRPLGCLLTEPLCVQLS